MYKAPMEKEPSKGKGLRKYRCVCVWQCLDARTKETARENARRQRREQEMLLSKKPKASTFETR